MKTVNNYLYKHYYFNNDGTPDEIADSFFSKYAAI